MKYFTDTVFQEDLFYPGLMPPVTGHTGSVNSKPAEVNLFSVAIKNCAMQNALDMIVENAVAKNPANFAFVNADCLNKAWTDQTYRQTLSRMKAVFADGIGVKMAGKMEGYGIVDNVNGTDLFPLLCQQAAEKELKIFLLGARQGVAETCVEKMCKRIPGLVFAGVQHGYFKKQDTVEVIDRINASGADILIVAFGAPMQEFWMDKHRGQLDVPVCIGVGGCIDFFAERIPRAPLWLRKLSMEWTWRLMQEPKRMWRRYIIGNPLFLYRAWRWAHMEIKKLLNREELLASQAAAYFGNQGHDYSRKFSTNIRVGFWQASIQNTKRIKRSIDVIVSSILLFGLSPLFLLLAAFIKLESKGPILFKQTRIGLGGKPFTFWKFRSMRQDAETIKSSLFGNAMSDGVRFKIKKDPRITRVGAFIRKYSIDELPQLWNVLKGDMSLVGPRPALPQEVAAYTPADKQRLTVVPGITCIWQVSGRSDIPFKQQVKMDVQYRLQQSVWGDLKLLLLTIPAVAFGKGAY